MPAVLIKMLVASDVGKIQLLPALPAAWPSGRIEGTLCRGAIEIESLQWSGKQVTVKLRSLKVGDASRTPPQLAVNFFDLQDALPRAGVPSKVLAVVRNSGGRTATNIVAKVHLPSGVKLLEGESEQKSLNLEGSVHFLTELVEGYLPDAVIFDFYRLADALLMPSREEGFGIPILEAGVSRLPIFCTDIPPLRELAGDRATYFSPDATPEQVAAQIAAHLATDPRYAMGVHVRSAYSWEGVYAQRIAPLLVEESAA